MTMLWFFEREDESLCCETHFDNDRWEFVAVVKYPNGSERTERFSTLDDFRRWIVVFDQLLQEQHWVGRTGPIVLPYGWPHERPK